MNKRSKNGGVRLSLVLAALLTAGPAGASNAGPTSAAQIVAAVDGHVYFEGSQNRTTPPACATYTRWAIDVTTPTGQALLSVLMTRVATGKTFTVSGQGTCAFNSKLKFG